MTVGFAAEQAQINYRAGELVMHLRNSLRDIRAFKVFLDSKTDPQLTTLGFTAPEITLLRASFTDLDKLAQVAAALATQSPASDFFFNAKLLLGVQ